MSFQTLINGISTGTVYALIAIGFALVFNILKFSNFSYGATMTASAFIAYFLVASKGWGLFPTLVCSATAGALISIIGEYVGFRRILKNHSPSTYFFVSSITLGTLYEGIVTLKAGTNFYVYPNFFKESSVDILGAVVSKENIIMLVISVAALVVLALVTGFSRYFSLGAVAAAGTVMLVSVLVVDGDLVLRLLVFSAGLILFKHIPALIRIVQGREFRFSREEDITYKLDERF